MLLTLRCVHTKDKAMAMGLIQFAIGLFGNILNFIKTYCGAIQSTNKLTLHYFTFFCIEQWTFGAK